jgi:hypothetical protein
MLVFAMTDNASRRQQIRNAVAETRSEAYEFRDKVDAPLKEFVTSSVLNVLDNVETLWLGAKTDSAFYEALYLDTAEVFLGGAKRQLAMTKAQVAQYGGPEKVRSYR